MQTTGFMQPRCAVGRRPAYCQICVKGKRDLHPAGSNFSDVITTGRFDVSLEVSSMIATNTILSSRQLPEEFESIFCEHSEFVYRTAYRVTGSAEDAEDVMQTVFLRLFRNLPALEVRQKP